MGKRYELVAGELRVMSPSGWKHGNVTSTLHGRLLWFVEQHDLGMMFGAETGFRLARNPDTVRAPDIAFIAKKHLPEEDPNEAFWPGAPDLAVEVLSPDDRPGNVAEKVEAWLNAGCAAVWVVDLKQQSVVIHHAQTDARVVRVGEVLQDDLVVPGFSCPVDILFR
jgi:Uma2 family endonuclease